jgi:hypothetical protein
MSPDLRRTAAGLAAAACAAAALAAATHAVADPNDAHPADQRGFLNSSARCDADQVLVAYGRTDRALVAVCVARDGELEYRGVRLSDLAYTALPAGRTTDGAIVANDDGVTYAVSSAAFLVSEGDQVLYRDPWLEFHQPRFTDTPATTSSTATSSTAATTASTTPSPTSTTVSTTTVTMTKKPGATG